MPAPTFPKRTIIWNILLLQKAPSLYVKSPKAYGLGYKYARGSFHEPFLGPYALCSIVDQRSCPIYMHPSSACSRTLSIPFSSG